MRSQTAVAFGAKRIMGSIKGFARRVCNRPSTKVVPREPSFVLGFIGRKAGE